MNSIVCTLFEKHYHFGVAALTNSLFAQGYKGEIFAGYRGDIPSWASKSEENKSISWTGTRTLALTEDFKLHLIPLDTDYHLTNYKPDFMLRLLKGHDKKVPGIFYFDPDIVITGKWKLFETWIKSGVALCEDVNSPLSKNHPRRISWRKYFANHGITLKFSEPMYANGGFVGCSTENSGFLEKWKQVQEAMAVDIGGLQRSAFPGISLSDEEQSPFSPFGRTDQDALNATVEAWDGDVSIVGQEAMAFKPGEALLPHALGHDKPWQAKPLKQMLHGIPPRLVDREYWINAAGPLLSQGSGLIKRRKLSIKIAAFVSRFYKKNS